MYASDQIRLLHNIQELQYSVYFGAFLRLELKESLEKEHEMLGSPGSLLQDEVDLVMHVLFP